jgi:hypothetical protein
MNGDGVQCNELMNLSGHTFLYGYRFCLCHAQHREDAVDTDGAAKKGTRGMHFSSRNNELRTYESLIHSEKNIDYVSVKRISLMTMCIN